jgi:arylsulfatase
MFKRYAQYSGGTCDPLVISWSKGITARGELRHQYHHSVDIVPTILEIAGLEMPKVYRGVEQYPLNGVSMRYSFDAKPDDPTRKHRQYFAMLGTRGIWEDGWKATAIHSPISGKGHFDQDAWQLYHVDADRAESKDLAKENPDKLQALIKAWNEEAEKNFVLPLDDRSAVEILAIHRPSEEAVRERYLYYPETACVPEAVAASVRGRSYKILANVEIGDPSASGVLFAHGSRFGGHTLFLKGRKLHYVYNFLGIRPEQHLVSKVDVKPGKHTLGVEFTREKAGEHGESIGTAKLYIDEQAVAEGPLRTQPGKFTLSGDGLCAGYDSADAVSQEYKAPGRFKGGTLLGIGVTVEKTQYIDLEKEAKRMMMQQ